MRSLYYIALCAAALLTGCASTISEKTSATTAVEYRPAPPVTISPVDEMTVTLEDLGITISSPNAAQIPSASWRTGALTETDDTVVRARHGFDKAQPPASPQQKTAEVVVGSDHPKSKARITYSLSADPDRQTVTVSIDSLTVEAEQEVIKETTTREVVKESVWSRLNQPINFLIMLVVLVVIIAVVFRRKF